MGIVQRVTYRPIPARPAKFDSRQAWRPPGTPSPVSGIGPGGPQGPSSDFVKIFGPAKKLMAPGWTTPKIRPPLTSVSKIRDNFSDLWGKNLKERNTKIDNGSSNSHNKTL